MTPVVPLVNAGGMTEQRKILRLRDPNVLKSTGRIVYDPARPGMKNRTKYWCVALVDREITRHLRWWTDKEILNPLGLAGHGLCQPSWDAHISIVRGEGDVREVPPDVLRELWGKYQGREFEFEYNLEVRQSGDVPTYNGHQPKDQFWFVNVYSDEMTYIRKELGLPYNWRLHLTFGRTYD